MGLRSSLPVSFKVPRYQLIYLLRITKTNCEFRCHSKESRKTLRCFDVSNGVQAFLIKGGSDPVSELFYRFHTADRGVCDEWKLALVNVLTVPLPSITPAFRRAASLSEISNSARGSAIWSRIFPTVSGGMNLTRFFFLEYYPTIYSRCSFQLEGRRFLANKESPFWVQLAKCSRRVRASQVHRMWSAIG